jgi:hypothetical protein
MPIEYRYEVKIPLQVHQYFELERCLPGLGLYPRRAHPPRTVHSIYVDTPSLDDYLDNVSGVSNRQKTRLRWYDDSLETLALEFKIKRNRASHKRVFPLLSGGNLPDSARGLDRLIRGNPEQPALRQLRGLHPILEVEYRREYLTLGSDIRMTIDRQLRFRRLYPLASQHFHPSPTDVVIEFKYPVEAERRARAMLAGLPARVFRHSKYVIGVDTACG